jgi:hypothetical protein
MPNFVLLLRRAENFVAGLSPEQMQAMSERYLAWNKKIIAAGQRAGGERLHDTGRLMQKKDGQLLVTDGPYSELKEVVAGYFIITAESYEHAVEIARDCPHADYGVIELREIFEMPAYHAALRDAEAAQTR